MTTENFTAGAALGRRHVSYGAGSPLPGGRICPAARGGRRRRRALTPVCRGASSASSAGGAPLRRDRRGAPVGRPGRGRRRVGARPGPAQRRDGSPARGGGGAEGARDLAKHKGGKEAPRERSRQVLDKEQQAVSGAEAGRCRAPLAARGGAAGGGPG